jgi:type I restriction enzyme R subunit
MRQAIEEGFILDVLANYATYTAYWRLMKEIEDDPRYDKKKAQYLLKSFVELHPHAIAEKVRIMVEHFATQVQNAIGGKAKVMIVTRSRLHAVRYRLKALVEFSGAVEDGGRSYTETGMNGFSEAQTAKTFAHPENWLLIVANKFQTGFDQPLLHTVYVDKKLGGVNAVQTLSRLNRTHPEKTGCLVLDFANDADAIKAAFEPYYETTLLSEATDPNLLYEIATQLAAFPIYTEGDVNGFARIYFDPKATQDQLYAALAPIVERFKGVSADEQHDFGGQLTDYVRLYAFLAQVLTFADVDLACSRDTCVDCCRPTASSCRARCSRTSTWNLTASSRRALVALGCSVPRARSIPRVRRADISSRRKRWSRCRGLSPNSMNASVSISAPNTG